MTFLSTFLLSFGSLVTTAGVNSVSCTATSTFNISPNGYVSTGSERTFNYKYTLSYVFNISETEDSKQIELEETVFTCVNPSTSGLIFQYTSSSSFTFDYSVFSNNYNFVQIDWQASSGRVGQHLYVYLDDNELINQQFVQPLAYTYFVARSDLVQFDNSTFVSQVDNFFNTFTNTNYLQGYNDGYATGERIAHEQGYNDGYADGYANGLEVDDTVFTVFNGILNIALVPINVLLGIFNFEVLGINISSLVTSALTVACVIIVIRMFLGGGGSDNGNT